MDNQKSQERSAANSLARMFILLADVGLLVWAWNLYQMKEAKYDSSGLALASPYRVPAQALNYSAAARRPQPMVGPERSFIKDPDLDISGERREARAPSPDGSQVRPETRKLISQAARIYFAIKKNPRFRDSATIQAWKRDFLSFPDLKAVDDQYNRDHDGVRFLVDMGRSPNFRLMLQRYLYDADIQAFIHVIRTQPLLASAAQNFFKDFSLAAALPIIPPEAQVSSQSDFKPVSSSPAD